ncbi:MAG: hypothetical protein Q4C13_02770 [Clostridia bacterium]|nr:hypothetical protein [Clostridia bacterium]
MTLLMDYILLAIGVYVLINAIRGKGKLFAVENIKEEYAEKFPKVLRAIYLPMGILMLLNGGVSLLKSYLYEQVIPEEATESTAAVYGWALKEGRSLGGFEFLTPGFFNIATYICMGLVVAAVVVLIVFMRRMTDKNAPAAGANASDPESQKRAERQAGHVLPVSAFEFDDEETK